MKEIQDSFFGLLISFKIIPLKAWQETVLGIMQTSLFCNFT